MSPPISFSKAKTSYPIFAATFAHNHPGCLVVGGGGGSGRSGVGNKITVFDVSSRAAVLESTAEIELSRDEDSVTCLANLATKDGLVLFAGINSSESDRLANSNKHFRSFLVEYPKKKPSGGKRTTADKGSEAQISLLGKTSLFKPVQSASAKKEGYQRLLRLSRPRRNPNGGKRIGAIASSLAGDENEIVVFDATTSSPRLSEDIIQRIPPHEGKEANDIDILELEEAQFQIAYCTDYSVFVGDISYDFDNKKPQGDLELPRAKYSVPFPDVFESKGRFKIRCLRWLSPSHILLLANLPNRTGVELQVLKLYGDTMGSITLRKRLPRHVKAAVDMDVCALDADENGAYQIVIAVGGIDISISIFTMNYHGTSNNSLSGFHNYVTVRDVHAVQMTKIVFSPFFSPWTAPNADKLKTPPPQYLRLVSTSLGNTIVIDTITLYPISKAPRARYILSSAKAHALHQSLTYFVIAFVLLIGLLLAQSLLDTSGTWTTSLVPSSIRNAVNSFSPPGAIADSIRSAQPTDVIPENVRVRVPIARASHRLRDLLHLHHGDAHEEDMKTKAVVVRDDPDSDFEVSTEVHPDRAAVVQQHDDAKRWEELTQAERLRWKKKLTKAGMWAVEEGETVLKGIFFSEAAGLVGQAAQAVLNG
ncbi:hypothetical protein K432DRAFT_434977 [Lepidopterella palustris CBS 459.81]|uniref:Guanine nucleotide-exchange factor SEC12 n=1 Tax=Lepidopterella palustris CBS 459.81 TaxID=1314670 RepID=A0A8E2EA99_9PEZI|nr:hypothetical protein K432DRAFT_434977 [Lepidopterella palustris CBS 459.81]